MARLRTHGLSGTRAAGPITARRSAGNRAAVSSGRHRWTHRNCGPRRCRCSSGSRSSSGRLSAGLLRTNSWRHSLRWTRGNRLSQRWGRTRRCRRSCWPWCNRGQSGCRSSRRCGSGCGLCGRWRGQRGLSWLGYRGRCSRGSTRHSGFRGCRGNTCRGVRSRSLCRSGRVWRVWASRFRSRRRPRSRRRLYRGLRRLLHFCWGSRNWLRCAL